MTLGSVCVHSGGGRRAHVAEMTPVSNAVSFQFVSALNRWGENQPSQNLLWTSFVITATMLVFDIVLRAAGEWSREALAWLKRVMPRLWCGQPCSIVMESVYDMAQLSYEKSDRFGAVNEWVRERMGAEGVEIHEVRENNSSDSAVVIAYSPVFTCVDADLDLWVRYSGSVVENEAAGVCRPPNIRIETCELRSYTMDMTELLAFVDSLTLAYRKRCRSHLDNGPLFHEAGSKFAPLPLGTTRTFDSVFFPEKLALLAKLDTFCMKPEIFDTLQIPRHFGILLHGKPGCGKTSVIKAIANRYRRHIITVPLAKVRTSKELSEHFFNTRFKGVEIPMERRMYVLEDIDCMKVTHSREINYRVRRRDFEDCGRRSASSSSEDDDDEGGFRTKIKDPVTLSHLLNLLDGLCEMPGRIVVFTTNFVERLDKALIRPGRVDMSIKLEAATRATVAEMIRWRFGLALPPEGVDLLPDKVLTPARIINLILDAASVRDAVHAITQAAGGDRG